MTKDSIINLLLSVVIPTILAFMGGLLAIRALDQKQRVEKNLWIASFSIILFIAIGAGFVQQVLQTSAQKEAATKAALREKELDGAQKYTQGQLDSINHVLTAVVSSGQTNSTTDRVLKALLKSTTRNSGSPSTADNGPRNPETRCDAGLRSSALDAVSRLRKLESDTRENVRQARSMGFAAQENNAHELEESEWQRVYVGYGVLRDRLVACAPAGGALFSEDIERDEVTSSLAGNRLAGVHPLAYVAGYSERLALMLPDK